MCSNQWRSGRTQISWRCEALRSGRKMSHKTEIPEVNGRRLGAEWGSGIPQQSLTSAVDGLRSERINRSLPRDIRIRRLARRHGLSRHQAELLAGYCYGEVRT